MKMRMANQGRLETTVRALAASVLAVVLVGTAACSKSSSGGGAASSAVGSASAGSSLTSGGQAAGPLLQKAAGFHRFVQDHCIHDGLLYNVSRDAAGNVAGLRSGGDSCIWTGLYVAAEAERYRATGDPDALAAMERSLRGLHVLHDITPVSGYLTRYFGRPPLVTGLEPATGQYQGMQWHDGTQSRDQYTGWMLGVALAWPHIQDQTLRLQLQDDCRQIAAHLMRNRLKLVVPRNGVDVVHFDLNPDSGLDRSEITPQSWATVDDFPINVIAQAIPYDPDIADAVANATLPPIKAGEAVRALMFFKVMAMVTGDPTIEAYYRNELIGNRDFLSVLTNYATIQDDVFSGRNLHVVVDMMRSMGGIVTDVLAVWVRNRTGRLGPFAGPLAARLMRPVVDWIARQVGRIITSAIQWLSNPNNMSSAGAWAGRLQTLGTVMSTLGLSRLGQRLQAMGGQAGPYMQSDLETARRTMQSGVGLNLTYSALYGLLELETDPNVRAVYQDYVQRRMQYDAWNRNSYFNLIHDTYAATGPAPGLSSETVYSLLRHYSVAGNHDRVVDNSSLPGVVASPWPDRFGRVGNLAVDPFSLDQLAPHHWPWQEHPCKFVSGGRGVDWEYNGGGYLLAYWLGRRSGMLQPGW